MSEKIPSPPRVETPASYEALIEHLKGAQARVDATRDENGKYTDAGYGKCVEELRDAGLMAMNLVARELGVTGWQFSSAEMALIQSSRQIRGPFMFVKLEDELFPQHDVVDRIEQFVWTNESREFLKLAAQEKLDETAERRAERDKERETDPDLFPAVHPSVLAHWEELAAWMPVTAPKELV